MIQAFYGRQEGRSAGIKAEWPLVVHLHPVPLAGHFMDTKQTLISAYPTGGELNIKRVCLTAGQLLRP